MPDLYTLGTCAVLMLTTWGYSLILRRIRRFYANRWVWLTVAVGCAIVGLFVAVRMFLLPLPAYVGTTLLAWAWWQWVYHFVIGGIPMIWWQIDDDHKQLLAAVALRAERPKKEPAP